MRRSLLAVLAVAITATLPVDAVSQGPATPPQQPTTPAPVNPANAAPTISLSTDPAKQVFGTGERLIVVATASDDTDSPERLLYQWTMRNLATGVEQPARSTALRQVRTQLRVPGKYEYKCVVTDTAGAAAEATLVVAIEDAGTAEVAGLAFDDSTAALHHVTEYWREGFLAIRRGDWATIKVSVRNFIAGAHVLRVYVDGKLVEAAGSSSAWAAQNLGGSPTERQIRLFVPPDAGAGKHSIEVAVIRRGSGGEPDLETARTAFSPEPLVLFNPWRSAAPDASVYATQPLPNDSATRYARGTQDLFISSQASESVHDVTPHDKAVVKLAQEIIASLPHDARGDAGRVTAAMAAYVGGRALAEKQPAGNASDPYPSSLTGLLRSVGIPARRIAVIGAGRDVEAEWGVLQTKYTCRRWNAMRCDDPQTTSAQEQLNLHTWNEVWIPGTINDGWAAAGATPVTRGGGGGPIVGTPSLKGVREFPRPARGQRLPENDDAAVLYGATNLPWEIWWKAQDNNWYQASGPTTALHGFVSNALLQRSDELANYGIAPAEPKALQINAGPVVNLRSATSVKLSASGLGAAPSRLGVAVLHLPRELSAGTIEKPSPGGLAFATILDVKPAGGTWTGTIEIPREVFSVAGAYEIAVGPQQGAAGPSGRARIDVRGLPIAVALPAKVEAGATFAVSAQLVNSSDVPVGNATLQLNLPIQLRMVGGAPSGAQETVPPGGTLRINGMVQALSSGSFLAGASSESSAGFSESYAPLAVMRGARVFLAGEPALGVTVGNAVTVTANVMLDAIEASGEAEVELRPVGGTAISLLSDARKSTSSLVPDDRWTPSWQVLVNTPGTYRLPVRAGVAGVGEAIGEILLVAGAADPDEDVMDDFEADGSLGYRSPKAIFGAAGVVAALLLGAVYLVRRRRSRKVGK